MNSEVSRKPINYEAIYEELIFHKENGYILWVIGPALVHSRGREAMEWLIANGYCDALLSGNAVAVQMTSGYIVRIYIRNEGRW